MDVSHVTTAFWRHRPLAGQQTRWQWQMRFRSSDPLKNTVQKQQHAENIQTSILTRWSVAVRWSHLNRTPEDGSSSPPAPHTLSCSLDGNIQSHCETQEKLVWRILSNLLRQNRLNLFHNNDIPVIIIHRTRTGGQLLSDSIVPPVPADGVFPQA